MTFLQAFTTLLVALVIWRVITFIIAGLYIGKTAIDERRHDRKLEKDWQIAERSIKLRESKRDPYYTNLLLDEKFQPFIDEIAIALRSYALREYKGTVVYCDFPEQLSVLLARLGIRSTKAKRSLYIPAGQNQQARDAEENLFGIRREHDSVQPCSGTQLQYS